MFARPLAASLGAVCAALVLACAPARATSGDTSWPVYGGDLANTRYANLDQINTTNASKLRPAWIFHTGLLDSDSSFEGSPVIVNGILYITTGHDQIFALSAATGSEIWQYQPQFLAPLNELPVCCTRSNRGVAYGNGKVFIARLDGVVDAVDAATGKAVWENRVLDFRRHYALTMAPQFFNNTVYVGSSGGEYEIRGRVSALDADTGKLKWTTYTTIAGPTWAHDSFRSGGAPVWQTPAVDAALGLIYVNTGNAAPDVNGGARAGDNHYSSSLIALDANTGDIVWGFQEVHHDLWDYDAAQPSMLFDVRTASGTVPALGECGKNGNYYILDRRNGKPVFPVTEVDVSTDPAWQFPAVTQPVSSVEPMVPLHVVPGTVDPGKLPSNITIAEQYAVPQKKWQLVQPGDDGGCEFPPGAFSPRTNFAYYGARYEPAIFHSFPGDFGVNREGQYLGSKFAELVPGVRDYGVFGATDTVSGKVVWRVKVAQPAKSGVLVAGDVVYFGEGNGRFHGVDARTGKRLFSFDGTTVPRGGGAQGAPVAYVAGGTEFVVNAFGGNADDAENFPPNPLGDALIAFSVTQKRTR